MLTGKPAARSPTAAATGLLKGSLPVTAGGKLKAVVALLLTVGLVVGAGLAAFRTHAPQGAAAAAAPGILSVLGGNRFGCHWFRL